MTHHTATEAIATIGIDLGKNTFHLIGMDARGSIVLRRKIARGQLLSCLANLPVSNEISCPSISTETRVVPSDIFNSLPAPPFGRRSYLKLFLFRTPMMVAVPTSQAPPPPPSLHTSVRRRTPWAW